MNPLISVIVPVYNVEEFLPKCIDSIVNQTYQNLEILLVNDGSTDNCPTICDEWSEKDQRIRAIHQKNGGVSSARNAGLDIMQGEYLMFVDSDDWLSLDAVEILYNRLIRDNCEMVIGQTMKIYDDGHTEPTYCNWMRDMQITAEKALRLLVSDTPIPCYPCGKLMKRHVYDGLRFPSLCRGEDMWIFPHLLERCKKISLESKVLYFYYQRAESAVHASKEKHWLDNAEAAFHVAQFLIGKEMWAEATVYSLSGLVHLQKVQNVNEARKLVINTFSWTTWRTLAKYNKRCWLCGLYLCTPKLYKTLQKMWRMIK